MDPQVYTQREWFKEFSNLLSARHVYKCGGKEYWNHPELPPSARVQGYSACYQSSDRYGYVVYLMISRSRTDYCLRLEDILSELRSTGIQFPFADCGEYHKHLREPGTWATIKSGDRWLMLSRSGLPKPHHKLASRATPFVQDTILDYAQLKKRQIALRSIGKEHLS